MMSIVEHVSATAMLPKIHLGCGEIRLDGYINVDHPPAEHTVQTQSVADLHADIRFMDLKPGTVSEVRLHHVLEHFPRIEAVALLLRWSNWLCQNGLLVVETPDFDRSIALLRSPWFSAARRNKVMRHIFGSQEASWAYHYDGWSESQFKRLLGSLGYGAISFETNSWKDTRNIVVIARKVREFTADESHQVAEQLLKSYTVDDSDTEARMLETWMRQFKEFQAESKRIVLPV
jgi:predicted SAM-dependent methyltransferase